MYFSEDLKQNYNYGCIKGFAQAIIGCYQQQVYSCLSFNTFLRGQGDKMNNLTQKKTGVLEKGSQRLFPDIKEDLWNIWMSFSQKEAEFIIKTINERKFIGYQDKFGLFIGLNMNSFDFFRDANFSISLYDNSINKELVILGFKILPNKEIEVCQLQGKGNYGINGLHFNLLLEETKIFLKDLGFRKIFIIRAEKLFYYRTPVHVPDEVVDLRKFILENRERMMLIYNINPIRKWGFRKVKDIEKRKWYKAECEL